MSETAARLASLGIILPPPPQPIGLFTPAFRMGQLLFLSGLAPAPAGSVAITGKVGIDFTAEDAQVHARMVGLNLLAAMLAELGDLDRVKHIVKVVGFVNATPDFVRHPFVIDGCSALFAEIFPHFRPHARTSLGVSSLPNNIPVEIEAIVEIGQD